MPAPKKKKQHYVPRFLLRNFAADPERRRIRGFALDTGQEFEGGIAEQCYEDYFYGKDQIMEESFAKEETLISSILRELTEEALEAIDKEKIERIKVFMHYQKHRTAEAAEYVNRMSDALLKTLVKKTLPVEYNGRVITESDLDLVSVTHEAPQLLALHSASGYTPLLWDLSAKFIIGRERCEFIISDNPITVYNQYLEHDPHLRHCQGITGLGVKGFQMFLPLSPRVCIALYDPVTYSYESPKRKCCFASKRDVFLINQLQALYAHECIYYGSSCTSSYRDQVLSVRQQHDVHAPRLQEGADPERESVESWSPEARIGAEFSFARVVEQTQFRGYPHKQPPIRSPDLMAFTLDFRRRLLDGSLFRERAERNTSSSP